MKIFAVIVTYYPVLNALLQLVKVLQAGGAQVIVADNTPNGGLPTLEGCIAINMGGNTGIAKAQNVAIQRARVESADVVVFFDQDSTVEPDLVWRLAASLNIASPGLIGPVYFEEKQGFECPNYVLNKWGYPRKVLANGRTEAYPVDVRISSGSAVTAITFSVVGLFDEGLFLDYVDIEWCLRARACGVPIRINPALSMMHTIGNNAIQIGPIKVWVDGPVRTYYRMRNSLLLLRYSGVPKLFAFKEIAAELVHQTLQLIIAEKRADRFGELISGFWHGVIGRKGMRGS